ncbi:hypothetical protein GCM10011506_18970 [Marivirga lumbricoides]|uniref:Toxin-antitoxin system YwqK family antitoxin n=1 Tax=Marivirga lumbricoides TaxID=1046115 RepID=A0ABQ1M4Z3_9BACT|nr:hypothetical protein GCM10011506_18970 [Marivirga lumbricoides]
MDIFFKWLLLIFIKLFLGSCSPVEKKYYSSGKIAYEYNLENGKKDGIALKYYESGELMQKSNYINGVKVGKSITYYKNGKEKYNANFVNNKQHGWAFYYDSLGNLMAKQKFGEGHLDGEFEEYYTSGELLSKGTNNYKKATKVMYGYFPNGDPRGYVFERNDSLIYSKTFNDEGYIIKTYYTIRMKKEDDNMLSFVLEKSIIPEDEISVEVVFRENTMNVDEFRFRSDGYKVCVARDRFKNKDSISGRFCELIKEDQSYQGCNEFSFDL